MIYLISYLSITLPLASAFELLHVDRGLEKMGLHRDLVTNVTFRLDSELEVRNNSLIFREMVTNDTYIYLEELRTRKPSLEFWPEKGIDIEKPASVSTQQ